MLQVLLGLAGVFAWLIPWLLEEHDSGRRLKAAAAEAAAKEAPTPAHARQPLSHFSLQYQDDNSGCRRSITYSLEHSLCHQRCAPSAGSEEWRNTWWVEGGC